SARWTRSVFGHKKAQRFTKNQPALLVSSSWPDSDPPNRPQPRWPTEHTEHTEGEAPFGVRRSATLWIGWSPDALFRSSAPSVYSVCSVGTSCPEPCFDEDWQKDGGRKITASEISPPYFLTPIFL